jgi:hypothetical protein
MEFQSIRWREAESLLGEADFNSPALSYPEVSISGTATGASTRQVPKLQVLCVALGAMFAATDAGAIILASLLGAKGYQSADWKIVRLL